MNTQKDSPPLNMPLTSLRAQARTIARRLRHLPAGPEQRRAFAQLHILMTMEQQQGRIIPFPLHRCRKSAR